MSVNRYREDIIAAITGLGIAALIIGLAFLLYGSHP